MVKKQPAEYVSRKFVLASGCLAGGLAVIFMDKDAYGYAAIITSVLAFYNGTNVYQDYVHARYGKGQRPVRQEGENE